MRWNCLLFLIGWSKLISSDIMSLNGKHIVVGTQVIEILFSFVTLVHLYVTRNISGHIIKLDGVAAETLDSLARRLNFTYSVLQVNDNLMEGFSNALPGLAFYITNGMCDVVIGPVVTTPSRFAIMDFAEGFMYTSGALLIPMPTSSENVAAVAKPFQRSVWISLFFVMPITAAAIYFFILPKPWLHSSSTLDRSYCGKLHHISCSAFEVLFEVFRILMNQGGSFPTMRNTVCFVVGSWCLGALVVVSAYNSLLTSYILGSNAEPLVDSLADVAANSKVNLVVDKGLAVDVVVSGATVGLYKQLGDKLRSNKNSRCVTFQGCIDLVKSGSYTYLNGLSVTLNAIDGDYKSTRKCNLALARKPESVPASLAWALSKKSPYTKSFTKGFMELHQAGLIDEWTNRELHLRRNVSFCLNEAKKVQQRKISDNLTKITLKNFSGAFYVLVVGYVLSLICFFGENIYFRLLKYYGDRQQVV
ncbi:Uncharacterized protein APZ42_023549 [Daphnia magna]|uniref:Uncharacterized protein n=1 Tax=Daphnia magna TaxID=35525 RepID=A0A162DGY1_9CRUS|nr:Uncharacterized protein APZ42_023549 [Daphnia magna]